MNDFGKWIEKKLGDRVLFDEPMASHTSFRTGGPADIFCMPSTVEDAVAVIRKARENKIPLFVTGGGTNLLVLDRGIRGVVLTLRGIKRRIELSEDRGKHVEVNVSAGTLTPVLCSFAVKNALSGMNFALGIPGTVGGAVRMNAGTRFGSMEEVIKKVTILGSDGRVFTLGREALSFSYRKLNLPKGAGDGFEPVILGVTFLLARGDRKGIIEESRRIIEFRKQSQPTPFPSAGCFFKNPPLGEPAGKLIDLAGLKGLTRGDAAVSRKHANFIVNRGDASACDILELMETVRKRVHSLFDVELSPEVEIVGT